MDILRESSGREVGFIVISSEVTLVEMWLEESHKLKVNVDASDVVLAPYPALAGHCVTVVRSVLLL